MSSSSSSSMAPAAVRLLEQCRVSPPRSDGPPPSLPLTFFDVFWVGTHPVSRLFFYPCPDTTADFVASALPRLKSSLSSTLRLFYPLAGRLARLPGSDQFHIHCADSDSVAFTLAEGEGDFRRLAGDIPRGVGELRALVPPAAHAGADGSLPLLAVQVTVFPRAGFCVGVSIHHAACDGSGFARFVRSWAAASRSAVGAAPGVEPPAVLDRALVSDPGGLYAAFLRGTEGYVAMERPRNAEGGAAVDDMVRSTFLLRRGHVEVLRDHVSRAQPPSPPAPPRYSTFVLTCAYVWVTLLKTRRGAGGHGGVTCCFGFVVDCRARLDPPLPATYFGNCLASRFVEAPRGELVGEGGVGKAAAAIAGEIGRLGEGGGAVLLRGAEGWATTFLSWLPRGLLTVAGSPRFGVYGADFGWGRPEKVEVVGIEGAGAVSLAESREEEGGVEVGVTLPSPEMEVFASLFAGGLDALTGGKKGR